ncbi:putative oxidoreductase GLYR1 homolog [Trichonephila clavipes]|nr:putative oxidoreductase GLYR1 homolog [Trichonephila clavipes]
MKHLEPTKKKIGFLGLGKMGQRIVKNLLMSRHIVNIWNRTKDKCKLFVEAGAIACKSPAEVVENSDIIFNCVSDVFAVKTILFCPDGVLKGLENCCTNEKIFKGYVEMSTIGYESSVEIASDINDKGGRYLEACMTGTRTAANLGKLFIVASGDRYVFEECASCFHAIAENALFVSTTIGISSKLSNTLSMCIGTGYAALAEATSLANRLNVNMDDILTLLQIRGIAPIPLLANGTNMIKSEYFNVEHSLKNQQKDMDLGLRLSDDYDHPLYLAAAANEVYKHAKMLGYGDLDVSAVVEGLKR